MAQGISLHVGINYIDEGVYGTKAELENCVNDAEDFRDLAEAQDFETTILINEEATAENIFQKWIQASEELVAGDIFLYTISSHGAQVPALPGDEEDNLDETHVLFDRQIIDNEYYELQSLFQRGVFVVMISDSCHSGTVFRPIDAFLKSQAGKKINKTFENLEVGKKRVFLPTLESDFNTIDISKSKVPKLRTLETKISKNNFKSHRESYQDIQKRTSRSLEKIRATSLLISGCQDNQLSSDGTGRNGLMTQTLLHAWNSGKFIGNYRDLYQQILGNMPFYQTPNLAVINDSDGLLLRQKPFTINAASLVTDTRALEFPEVLSPSPTFPILNLKERNMQLPTDNTRFIETVAAIAATAAAEALVEEVFRGGDKIA